MDPYQENDRSRFFKSIESSFRGIEWARNLNRSLIEEYTGNGYGTGGTSGRVKYEQLVNLMNQTVDAYTMALVANRPRVMVTSVDPNLRYFAKQYELAINRMIEQIGLEYTLKKWVLDAFFCVGIIKVHMADAGLVQIQPDRWMDPGQPFASNISIDNFVYDLSATKYSEVKYAGDMYRIPFADLKSGIFDPERIKDLTPTSKYALDGERLARISRGVEVDSDEFEPMIDLADIWVPRHGKIYTFAVDRVAQFTLKGEPIAEMDWTGPELGPYHLLGFNAVPENIMPTSPASHLAMMSRLVNNLFRKQSRRARNQRNVHGYDPAAVNSIKNIQKAGDDEFVEVQDAATAFHTISIGGVDANTQNFALAAMDMFDRMAGNLTAMLGLGAQAETNGQEQLIHGAVSKKEANMQYRVVDGAVRLIRNLGYMLWEDRFKVIRQEYPIDGAEGYSVDMTWTPEDRQGDFYDYDFNIDLYSMPYQSPSQKMSAVMQLLTQFYLPSLQLLQSQGGTINLQEVNYFFAQMLNSPELKNMIQFTSAPPEDAGGLGGHPEGPMMPAATKREYVRKSVSTGGTPQGKNHAMQLAWASAAKNQNQNQGGNK